MNILVLGLGCNKNDEIDDRFDLENFEQLIVGTWKAEKDVIDCFPDSPENTNIEILDECESQSILTIESAGVASDLILISTRYFNFQGTCQMTEDSPRNLELSLDGEVLLIRFPPDAEDTESPAVLIGLEFDRWLLLTLTLPAIAPPFIAIFRSKLSRLFDLPFAGICLEL